jgi:predicted deacylase
MRNTLTVGDTQAKPGEIAKGSLGSVEMADGSKVKIPLISINGREDGPVLTVVAGVHGGEVSPVGALLAAVKKIDPAAMKGALLAVPGANPLALRAGEQQTPMKFREDLGATSFLPPLNLETASITQRIAHYIGEALQKADYVMDMHANPPPSIPFVLTSLEAYQNDDAKRETRRMAEIFGVTVIDIPPKAAGTGIGGFCAIQGKPCIMSELAGDIYLWESITQVGTRGILNVMRGIGMLDGEPEKQDAKVVSGDLVFNGGKVTAQRGGFMVVKKDPGDKIKKGDTVAEIQNVYGDVVEEVKMPIDGYCWAFTGNLHGTHFIPEGHKMAFIFTERAEQP